MAALITAEKYLYDIGTVGLDYDLRYWSQACKSFTVSELNDMEIVFLSELDYSCSVSEQEFKLVLSNLKKFVDSPEAVSSFVLSPPSTPSPCRSPSSTD